MTRWLIVGATAGLTLVALSGCTSSEEYARRDNATCANLGLTPGTPEFAQCRIRIADARIDAINGSLDQGISSMNNVQHTAVPQQHHATCTSVGTVVNCSGD